MGSSTTFDDAICDFAVEYADQTQRDFRAFVKAVREGRIQAIVENQDAAGVQPITTMFGIQAECGGMAKDMNDSLTPLVRPGLKTPRAAATAGIVFSVLLFSSLWLLRLSVPTDPLEVGPWLRISSDRITVALNFVPIAGIAFMWFLGVLRDRLGAREDQFFATVFLGSGLMFLGMMFVAAAATGGLLRAYLAAPDELFHPSTFAFARSFVYDIMHIYAFKMAAVFMMSTSTLILRTRVTPRWVAYLGFATALILIIGSGYLDLFLFIFPAWVLLLSLTVLIDNLRSPPHVIDVRS